MLSEAEGFSGVEPKVTLVDLMHQGCLVKPAVDKIKCLKDKMPEQIFNLLYHSTEADEVGKSSYCCQRIQRMFLSTYHSSEPLEFHTTNVNMQIKKIDCSKSPQIPCIKYCLGPIGQGNMKLQSHLNYHTLNYIFI